MRKIGLAVVDGHLIKANLLEVKQFLWIKRYLVSYKSVSKAHAGYPGVAAQSRDIVNHETIWVKHFYPKEEL